MYAYRASARKIGDDPDHPRLIKTIRSKGYLFVPEACADLAL